MTKRVKRTGKLFSFRLYDTDDQSKYLDLLDQWLEDRPPDVSKSAEMTTIFLNLMKRYSGDIQEESESPVMSELASIRKLIERLIRNPSSAQKIADVAQQVNGDDEMIDSDVLANIMEDMGR